MFGIQTGVAIGFFVREKSKLGKCGINYACREDSEIAADKLAYLSKARMDDIEFEEITPDRRNDWLNQANPDFERLIPLANRETKFAKTVDEELAVFKLHSLGVSTNRDNWVYDFDESNLWNKALFFADTYNGLLDNNSNSYPTLIKWSNALRLQFQRGKRIVYDDAKRIQSLYRPFVMKHHFADFTMNDALTRNHYEMFGVNLNRA